MPIELTDAQRIVAKHADGNLLVSAGAGSGKTFVLIEHIINRITDPARPVDIDRFLVVTFTRAAAAEMSARIEARLSAMLADDPGNANLRRQKALVRRTQISTIDSFCSTVVRDFFHSIDLDPDIRLAEDGELKLLRRDVFSSMMEEHYRQADERFTAFMDAFTGGKDDSEIFALIELLLFKSDAAEDPRGYFEDLLGKCSEEYTSLDDIPALAERAREACDELGGYVRVIESWRDALEGGLYEETVDPDIEMIKALADAGSFTQLGQRLAELPSFTRAKRLKKGEEKSETDAAYQELRTSISRRIRENYKKAFIVKDQDRLLEVINGAADGTRMLAELALEFYDRYTLSKSEKGVASFADMEHYALEILKKDPGAQASLRARFDEVIIDEYQDSNDLQEAILTRVSRGDNMFMVGDVKQSIYGFRNAKPKLFTDKYALFGESPELGTRVDLTDNFRCRKEVIDAVNQVFDRIMTPQAGGVDYEGTARLTGGAKYPVPEGDAGRRYRPEFITIVGEDAGAADRLGLEALTIASRIRQLTDPADPLIVVDPESGELRPVRLSDIVILTRELRTASRIMLSVLRDAGIPAVATRTSGYFDAPEVRLILDFLRIIDNPRQDIPLAAVLASPMGGFDAEALAALRAAHPDGELYDALASSDLPLAKEFMEKLARYREMSIHVSIYELIDRIVDESCYDYYAGALEGGELRTINIRMLREIASDFEQTSYSSIFEFNRYVELIRKYDIDRDSGSNVSGSGNTVRIMTMHGSKGLEFPVVFVCNLCGRIRGDDAGVVVRPGCGLASDLYTADLRIKSPVVEAIRTLHGNESRDEEARLLYVAMTRAREKLIVVAAPRNVCNGDLSVMLEGPLPSIVLHSVSSRYEFVANALAGCSDCWDMKLLIDEDILAEKELLSLVRAIDLAQIGGAGEDEVYDPALMKALKRRFDYRYANRAALDVRAGYSVSALKKLSQVRLDEVMDDAERRAGLVRRDGAGSSGYVPDPQGGADDGETAAPEPAAKSGTSDPQLGALTGTAWHLIFEKLDPARGADETYISSLIDEYAERGLIDPRVRGRLRADRIAAFYRSDTGRRAAAAAAQGCLYREKPFVLGVPASDIAPGCKDPEPVVVQGIIDMYFTEGDRLVLVDYKSDWLMRGREESTIRERYGVQLEYYGRALEAALGRRPDETLVYLIRYGRFVRL